MRVQERKEGHTSKYVNLTLPGSFATQWDIETTNKSGQKTHNIGLTLTRLQGARQRKSGISCSLPSNTESSGKKINPGFWTYPPGGL